MNKFRYIIISIDACTLYALWTFLLSKCIPLQLASICNFCLTLVNRSQYLIPFELARSISDQIHFVCCYFYFSLCESWFTTQSLVCLWLLLSWSNLLWKFKAPILLLFSHKNYIAAFLIFKLDLPYSNKVFINLFKFGDWWFDYPSHCSCLSYSNWSYFSCEAHTSLLNFSSFSSNPNTFEFLIWVIPCNCFSIFF